MGYFLLCLAPVAMACFFIVVISQAPEVGSVGLGFSAVALALAVTYLVRLRLEITQEKISFHSLFGGVKAATFGDISSIVLISHDKVGLPSPQTEGSSRSRKLIITPKTGRASIEIPLIFFDSAIENELVRILGPVVWPD